MSSKVVSGVGSTRMSKSLLSVSWLTQRVQLVVDLPAQPYSLFNPERRDCCRRESTEKGMNRLHKSGEFLRAGRGLSQLENLRFVLVPVPG